MVRRKRRQNALLNLGQYSIEGHDEKALSRLLDRLSKDVGDVSEVHTYIYII